MKIKLHIKSIVCCNAFLFNVYAYAQEKQPVPLFIDETKTYQTIDNFGASDAWSCQFAGNWPDEKKNAIADWLFSMDTLANGNPKGIGLTIWRYNIGAGSAEQEKASGIRDEWRRAAGFIDTTGIQNKRLNGQHWFLMAAQKRGVQQFLGFFNSPPVSLTKNGKAFADQGICNIHSSRYAAFANYAARVVKNIQQATGITFNYISPVNEPQWNWSDGGQEGCPYSNQEISDLVKSFNREFIKKKLPATIIVPEAGHLKYLLNDHDKGGKGNQIETFFNTKSPLYIGDLPSVSQVIAGHSYFSTSPYDSAVMLRTAVKESIARIPRLKLWQSEYCILGDNAGEMNGSKRDLGMNAALYLAKVIHTDLTAANASAWQWWLAVSPYNYKDGLVYIDRNKTDGNYYDSKMLWVLGNYSRFIRPGMKRVHVTASANELFVSAFIDEEKGKLAIVLINSLQEDKAVSLNGIRGNVVTYTTNTLKNLEKGIGRAAKVVVPAKSVVTIIVGK